MSDSLQVAFVFRNTRATSKSVGIKDATEDLFKKALAIADSAKVMAIAGKDKNKVVEVFKEALITANAIKSYYLKNGTIRQICSCMNTAGLKENEIAVLFNEVKVTLPD
jgi:uncharacterized protein YihD (DUF1040 family)